jgi:hypothetical protein
VQFPKSPIIAVVAFACISLTSFPVLSQTTTSSQPVLKKAQERGSTPSVATTSPDPALSGGRTRERDFQDCLDTWDKGTHMTKKEWRRTCERTIRDYPELP